MHVPEIMPAGAMIPEEEVIETTDQAQDQGTPDQGEKDQEAAQAEQLILGKFKSPDDVIKAYSELETLTGRQSSDVGDLRKQNEMLLKQLELSQKPGEAKQEQAKEPSFDDQLAAISKQIEEGDIDIGQALKLTSEITANKTLHLQNQQLQQAEQQKSLQGFQDKFLQENPDFTEMQQNGTLQQIRAQNPWLYPDDIAAFQAAKIDQLKAQIDEATKSGYQQGRSDITKLAEGSEAARKVLAKPGADIRKVGNSGTPATDQEIRASMRAKLGIDG